MTYIKQFHRLLAMALATSITLVALFTTPNEAGAAERRKVIVGARNDAKGTSYVDANGRFTGLEGETLSLIFDALPQYDFELRFLPQSSLFPSLITNKVDLVHGNLRRTEEREKQAIRTKVANNWWPYLLATPVTEDKIHSLKDLEGKRIVQNRNSGQAGIMEQYIRDNKANIEIVYSPEFVAMLANGLADATLLSPFTLVSLNSSYENFKLKIVNEEAIGGPKGTPDGDPNAYFWLRVDDTKLRDEISEVLTKLKSDGTLSKLSIQFTSVDYPSKIDTEAEKDLKR
jgi:L-cystine transport system substrate-binding protein